MYKHTLAIFCCFAFFSCKKNKEVPPPLEKEVVYVTVHDTIKNAWKEAPCNGLLSNLFLSNAGVQGSGYTFISNLGHTMTYDSILQTYGSIASAENIYLKTSFGKPNMSYGLCVFPIDEYLTISGITPGWMANTNQYFVNLKKYDPGFINFSVKEFHLMNSTVITSTGDILVPAFTTNTTVNTVYRFKTKINFQPSSGFEGIPSSIDTIGSSRIVIPNNSSSAYRNIECCGHIDDKAFVYLKTEGKTYLIRPDNTYKPVLDRQLYGFFTHRGAVYALEFNGHGLYSTNDGGESWQQVGALNEINSWIQNFNNRLVCIYGNKLFTVTISAATIQFSELKNSGLENRIVTSITKFNGKVFLTTNGGLYTRDYGEFYD